MSKEQKVLGVTYVSRVDPEKKFVSAKVRDIYDMHHGEVADPETRTIRVTARDES